MSANNQSADVIVIGSGVAGALVAHDLSAAGASVLMLEAGPRLERWRIVENYRNGAAKDDNQRPYPAARHAPHPEYGPDNNYLILKGPDAQSYASQYLRVVGGTTWHWAASCWRFLPNDFHMKQVYGVGRDWGISYADLEPWYYKAELELGVSGPNDGTDLGSPRKQPYPMDHLPLSYNDQRFHDVLNANGFNLVAEPVARNSRPYDERPTCCGNNNCMPICPIAAMYSGIIHVLKAERAGTRLLTNAVVYRLEVDAHDNIIAALYKDPDGNSHRVTGKYFVLAANALESAKILLMSTTDKFASGLANSSDQVGRNLMDHPGTGITFLANEPLWPGRGPMELTSIVDHRDGDFRREWASKKLHLNNQSQTRKATEKALSMGLVGKKLDEEIRYRAAHTVNINSFHDILPEPDNRLVLSDQKDPLGLPRMEITYKIGDYTKRSAEHTHESYAKIAQLFGGTEVTFDDKFAPNNHLMGSVIMGQNPKDSVVDGDCRAHDHANLYLATSGVMASAGSVNCTLTIAALSLRIADTLKRQLGRTTS
ncbi:choline dehydrogenase-like flavoprotein [Silvimonas terrae]|uniref:Choline dehydrogenase-like flavoprotein n=1 Tax=Silvimonas terrae TaxID=300266 RepID=A0A840RKG5_9NEIS|nr:GMC family oxidoreductase [Silvimonas terrae]MBB5192722.1 choline dehydrogenase-like flavoprotein [Silvimonas terrae]